MKLATKIIQQDQETDENELNKNYKKLNNKITKVKNGSVEWNMIMELINDSKTRATVLEIFSLDRDGKEERYDKKIGNDQLLWHGSRLQNYVVILSRIEDILFQGAP